MIEERVLSIFYISLIVISIINIIVGYLLMFSYSKYNRKVRAELTKIVETKKKRPRYRLGFVYQIYGKTYKRLCEQKFKAKEIRDYHVGEKYTIFLQNKYPTSFVVKKHMSDIVIGMFFIVLGIFYLVSLIILF